ncbi:MAG: HU family DNA-binding protein [Dongiaceae bacterium]|jgi:DNA-binding protein HU-beta
MAVAKKPTITQRQLAAGLAEKHNLSKKAATELVDALVLTICKHLKKGDRVRLPSLGIFQVRQRKARMGINPKTREPIKIKASKKVAFRVAKELKTAI